MSFFKNLFGNKKEENNTKEELPWIEASENPWGLKILDLRPISQTMLSTSKDEKMAVNAISYGGEDGTHFWNKKPINDSIIITDLRIPIDSTLEPGVLFTPNTMEHKWAIFFDGENLIFVRSWMREVFVKAKTNQNNNILNIESITGQFEENETPEFTKAILNFLLISHCIGENVPAPLPKKFLSETNNAGLWAFSIYGNMAHIGIFDKSFLPKPNGKLRSHSLLHISVAKSDLEGIEKNIKNGSNINSLAGDGLGTLHWSIACQTTDSMNKLIELGANTNNQTTEGATALMNSAQSNKVEHLNLLIKSGADINAKDNRGFTALHRVCEMGNLEIVKILLAKGADKNVTAENHTPLSLAKSTGQIEIIKILEAE